jgi:apolipoprotein N-acyltransferase|tara:strand:- start:3994 stop:4323 length:330 start_codon:yes stop_codon:yes gene_type:complete
MKFPKIENLGFIGIIATVILVFFYFILGFSGMMAVLGIILLFIVPFYLILDNFDLSQDEKIVFSFFIGVGIFPAIVYWLGMIISFSLAILIIFAVLIVASYFVRKIRKK